MVKFSICLCLFFFVFFCAGCASLGELVADVQDLDATPEISAVSTLTTDVVDSPWDNIVQIGLGYVLALIRRQYKKKKGAK